MNTLKRYTIIGIFFVLITGTIAHFLYEWSGNNFILGLFFPVNESTWEHMKLCFFPMLLYSFYIGKKARHDYPDITAALLCGIMLGTFSIPVLFYTYSGILGRNYLPLDIGTFIASVLLAFWAVYRLSVSHKQIWHTSLLRFCVIAVTVCFLLFTYYPPDIGIFANPVP
ncbi:MAG: DUF6512 family protein [Lachnospiraceae bacterium]|nr:DUF6512 family protein [Lachnospiraceae bacterium]